MEERMNVLKAFDMALKAHSGQGYGDESFIWHPYRVAISFHEPRLQIISLLHDIIEDTDITFEDILKQFDYEIAETVLILTRTDELYDEYIQRLAKNKLARIVKIADLRENIFYAEYVYKQYQSLLPRYYEALDYLVKYNEN
jgi:(p)ppGpp synthase/HD superfamily hydrolase